MKPIANIVKPFHELFRGTKGHVTYGVSVQALEHDPNSGYSQFWDINDYSFRSNPKKIQESLGLTETQYNEHDAQLQALIDAEKRKPFLNLTLRYNAPFIIKK